MVFLDILTYFMHINYLTLFQGVDLDKVLAAGRYISEQLGRPTSSKVAQAKSNL